MILTAAAAVVLALVVGLVAVLLPVHPDAGTAAGAGTGGPGRRRRRVGPGRADRARDPADAIATGAARHCPSR